MKISLKANVGVADRILRICGGIIFLVLGTLFIKGAIGAVLVIFSIPLLASGIAGSCPGYKLLGISTNRRRILG